jgi:hypothetical protein
VKPFCLAVLIATVSATHAAEPSHCAPAETVIFSCGTGAKIVSVCATDDLSAGVGSLGYRFGPPGMPEMTYPPPGPWRKVVRSSVRIFSDVRGAWLAFHREAFHYTVYTATGRGWGEMVGVAVAQNGQVVANLACRGKPVSELGPDFFRGSGIPDDDAPFDLP